MDNTRQTGLTLVGDNSATATISARCGACKARHTGFCDALDDSDLHCLERAAHWQRIPKGRIFALEGDLSRRFFTISHGAVKLCKDLPDGRRQIIGFAGPGDFIGLAADQHYPFSAEAINDVRLCSFDRTDLRVMFTQFPALERRLAAMISSDLVGALSHLLLLGRKTSIERVASFLLMWSAAMVNRGDHHPTLALPMSRTDLGDYLGMTIETVSRSLTVLKKQHVIAVAADHGIAIVNRRRLSDIADAITRHDGLSEDALPRRHQH